MLLPDEPLEPEELVGSIWAPEALGDPRRHRRLVQIVTELLGGSTGQSPKQVRAADRGAARFWANDKVSLKVLKGQASLRFQAALTSWSLVVLAHDSSELDLHGRGEPEDAGPLRSNTARGYLLHGCSVVDLKDHALIGLLDHWAWARPWETPTVDRKQRTPAQKESAKWVRGLGRADRRLKKAGFQGRAIHAADREADDYKVFAYALRKRLFLVVRARHDRALAGSRERLWSHLAQQPPGLGWTLRIKVERLRPESPTQAAARATKAAATQARKRAVLAEVTAQRLEAAPSRRGEAKAARAQAQAAQAQVQQADKAAHQAKVAAVRARSRITRRTGLLAQLPRGPTTRLARVELRFGPVTILPTHAKEGTTPLSLRAIYVKEVDPPPRMVPVEWMLLTTLHVDSVEAALVVVDSYKARWGCEEFHKILKSGLALEDHLVKDLKGFRRVLAVMTAVASHLARWTHAARVTPNEAAANHLQPVTLTALKEASRQRHLPLPHRPWTLADVICRLAELGGYEPRPDRVPGWIVIWRGWRVLQTFWETYQFAQHRRKQAPG